MLGFNQLARLAGTLNEANPAYLGRDQTAPVISSQLLLSGFAGTSSDLEGCGKETAIKIQTRMRRKGERDETLIKLY